MRDRHGCYDGPDLAERRGTDRPGRDRGHRQAPGRRVPGGVAGVRARLRLSHRARPGAGRTQAGQPAAVGARPGRWPSRAAWPRCTRPPRPAAGGCSAGPARCRGIQAATRPRCSHRVSGSAFVRSPACPIRARQYHRSRALDLGPLGRRRPARTAHHRPGPRPQWPRAPRRAGQRRRRLGSLRLANALVGNDENEACLEVTLGRLALHFGFDAVVALSRRASAARCFGSARRPVGLRTYLAISGGIAVTPVLGSRSTDVLSGLGPPPLRPGQRLPVGRPRSRPYYRPGAPAARCPACRGAELLAPPPRASFGSSPDRVTNGSPRPP